MAGHPSLTAGHPDLTAGHGSPTGADEPGVDALIDVARAIEILDGQPVSPRVVQSDLVAARGLRLAQDVHADRAYPPFDKSLMDGYAVRCADVVSTPVELNVVGEIAAGTWPDRSVGTGEAIAIMTGAPLPAGADGVVPVEDIEPAGNADDRRVRVLRASNPARHVARRGSDCAAGEVLLERGTKLEAAQIAVAASVGASPVRVYARPRVAVLGTGDELVPLNVAPGPAQIRDSNTAMLVALLDRLGYAAVDLGFVRDDRTLIKQTVAGALSTFDALFITGGMSMGAYDYVPHVLLELGVTLNITKLRIKPGKPFVFGVGERSTKLNEERETPPAPVENTDLRPLNPPFIFGLPGNPVSGFACTLRLASRLLNRLAGAPAQGDWFEGKLTEPLVANGPREFYQPVACHGSSVTPLKWKGSADVYTLARANGLMVRAENEPALDVGAAVRVLPIPM